MKSFFAKTKVKIAILTATVDLLIIVAQALAENFGINFSEEQWMWMIGMITTLGMSLIGAHAATDVAVTKEKLKSNVALEIAKVVGKKN